MVTARHLFLAAIPLTLVLQGCTAIEMEEGRGETTANVNVQGTASSVNGAKQALEIALRERDATEERLQLAYGRVGPMLTPAQNNRFARAFQDLPDVKATAAAVNDRAFELAAEIDLATAGTSGPLLHGWPSTVETYALLAKTPAAAASIEFAVRVFEDDLRPTGGESNATILEKVLAPALAGEFVMKLFETGSTEQAKSALSRLLADGGPACKTISDVIEGLDALSASDITRSLSNVRGTNMIGSLRAIAGVMAIWNLGGMTNANNPAATLRAYLSTGPDAVGGIADGIAVLRRVVFGIEETALASRIAGIAGRIAGGLTSVFTVVDRIVKDEDTRWTPSQLARLAADGINVGVGVLAVLGAAPPAALILGITTGLFLIADLLEAHATDTQLRNDLRACLPATGLGATLREQIVSADAGAMTVLGSQVKLTPADFQWLATVDPMSIQSSGSPGRFNGLQMLQQVFSLDAAETGAFLRAALGNERRTAEATEKMESFFLAVDDGIGPKFTIRSPRPDVLQLFATAAADTELYAPAARTALTDARRYLAGRP